MPNLNNALRRIPALLAALLASGLVALFVISSPPQIGVALRAVPEHFGSGWRFPVHTAMAIFTWLVMIFAAGGLGLWLLGRLGALEDLPSPWQKMVFGILTGWVVLGTAAQLIGLAGGCNPIALGALVLVAAAMGIGGWRRVTREMSSMAKDPEREAEVVLPGWFIVLALGFYALLVAYAATPAIESDALRYHLAAPQEYLAAGRIHYLPHHAHSNFPFLIEMLFTIALALQGTEAARLVHLGFLESSATLTALIAFLLVRVSLGRGTGTRKARFVRARNLACVAAAAFATIPSASILACWAFVDMAMVAYFLAVVYLGLLAIVRRRPPSPWLMGLMAAGAVGTKLTMLPIMAGVAGSLLFLMMIRGRRGTKASDPVAAQPKKPSEKSSAASRTAIRFVLLSLAIAAAVASPWFIRNAVWTGNPVYPLANGIFEGGEWTAENAAFNAAKAAEKGFRGPPVSQLEGPIARIAEFALTPLTTSLAGTVFEKHFLGPVPLISMILIGLALGRLALGRFFLRARGGSGESLKDNRSKTLGLCVAWLLAVVVGYWTLWFFTYQSNRLLLPALALLIAMAPWAWLALVGPGATQSSETTMPAAPGRKWFRAWCSAITIIALLYCVTFTTSFIVGLKRPHPLAVALGLRDRTDYLDEAINYHRTARWLAARPEDARRAWLIGEHRTMYFPPGTISSDWFDTPQPLPWIRKSSDTDEMLDQILAEGVRYVVLNQDELARYAAAYFAPRFTDAEFERFEKFINSPRLQTVYNDERFPIYVFRIEAR